MVLQPINNFYTNVVGRKNYENINILFYELLNEESLVVYNLEGVLFCESDGEKTCSWNMHLSLYIYRQNKVTQLTFYFVLPQKRNRSKYTWVKEVGADIWLKIYNKLIRGGGGQIKSSLSNKVQEKHTDGLKETHMYVKKSWFPPKNFFPFEQELFQWQI